MYSVVISCVQYKSNLSEYFTSHIGLKQGDPSSSLLFLFFVNDKTDHINTDIEGIFTADELKLLILMFADDTVLSAQSPTSLQSMLTDLENYCNA